MFNRNEVITNHHTLTILDMSSECRSGVVGTEMGVGSAASLFLDIVSLNEIINVCYAVL